MTPSGIDVTAATGNGAAAEADTASGFDAAFDSFGTAESLSGAGDSAVADPEPEEAPLEATEETTDQTEPPLETQPEEQPEAPQEDELSEFQKAAGGKQYLVKPDRLNALIGDRKFAEEIRQIAPTLEDARNMATAASDFEAIRADVRNGSTQERSEFARFWANEAPENFASLTGAMIDHLAQQNPQAFSNFQKVATNSAIDNLYQVAAQVAAEKGANHKDASAALYAARHLDFLTNNSWRDLSEIKPRTQVDTREQELARREQALNSRVESQHTAYWNNTQKAINSQLTGAVTAKINDVLKPAEGRLSKANLDAIRSHIGAKVTELVNGDPEFSRNHGIQLRDIKADVLRKLGAGQQIDTKAAVDAYVARYMQKVGTTISRIAAEQVGTQTKAAIAQNQQQHAKLKAGQRPGVANGAPVQKSITPPGGKTFDDLFNSIQDPRQRQAFR